jgi:hypothetical protein
MAGLDPAIQGRRRKHISVCLVLTEPHPWRRRRWRLLILRDAAAGGSSSFETPLLAAPQDGRHLMVRRPKAVSNHESRVSI